MTNANRDLRAILDQLARRRSKVFFWSILGACWGVAACVALILFFVARRQGWTFPLALATAGATSVCAILILALRKGRTDHRSLAAEIEEAHPQLQGRLLTAVQQPPQSPNFLQQRLLEETLAQAGKDDWSKVVPRSRVAIAQAGHWLALLLLGFSLWGLWGSSNPTRLAQEAAEAGGVTVSPGDIVIEKGNSLVVFARFSTALPSTVELVIGTGQRVPLTKSLADPVFGGSIPEVSSNFSYRIEYAADRTRDFQVSVFEYPRLEKSDVDLDFPAYTAQPHKRIENTKRLTAVEGSTLNLALQLNKAVASAVLVPKDKAQKSIRLAAETNRAVAMLSSFPLEKSAHYDLHLVDLEGRTNKVPAQFVFDVLTNRLPEFRLALPRGDLRPSPIEEITFEGTVWDDFGLQSYGLGYSIPLQETKFVELGKAAAGKDKKSFQYTLHLEDLGLEPDQLISWFLWADDVGPDGSTRRSTGDLFFGEVRPFDEIFRENDGQAGGGEPGQQGQGQTPTAKLTELQKQIISATWKLRRESRPNESAPKKPSADGGTNRESRHIPSTVSGTLPRLAHYLTPSSSQVFGQADGGKASPADRQKSRNTASSSSSTNTPYADDAAVVRDSQAQALEQAEQMTERVRDARTSDLWKAAKKEMEKALQNLEKATASSSNLPEALAAEQAAYQALLKLQQHEYQVMRNQRNQRGGGSSSRDQQMRQQLEQMDLKKSDDRYETQRQAQKQPPTERREQLQVQNRLQELARRQQDLNDRLKELQTELQEARTEQEREEIKRRLKRLEEQEQQMLSDVDELKQRMERPENQSRMAEERKQLEETRKDVQQAAEAASQGSPSQALASGTRAQRQLQQMRDQVRKQNSSQFSDELRQMRSEARELARQQEDVLKKLEQDITAPPRSLGDSTNRQAALQQLSRQAEHLTNLVDRATQISQDAEEAEPVVSRQLYDSVRKFAQESSKAVQQTQEELLGRGQMTRNVYDRLRDTSQADGPKLLDVTSELVKQDLLRPALQTAERTRGSLDNLKRGVERAAESVLGDDTEALKLAQQEIDRLTDQLQREMQIAQGQAGGTNGVSRSGNANSGNTNGASARASSTNELAASANGGKPGREDSQATQGQPGQGEGKGQGESKPQEGQPNQQPQPGEQAKNGQQSNEQASNGQQQGGQQQGGQQQGEGQGQNADGQRNAGQRPGQRGDRTQQAQAQGGNRRAGNNQNRGGYANDAGGVEGGDLSGSLARSLDRLLADDPVLPDGPLTGENFTPWSDRLRDVEEMVDDPALRNEVATARERARLVRQQYKNDRKKPDWAVVQMQVMQPLREVRDRIADELARRESSDSLVPIDRDPVPNRYSDLVRRYYEELGKEK